MKITSSIDGKRVEEWSGDPRLPTILTQDELDDLPDTGRIVPKGGGIFFAIPIGLALWAVILLALWAVWPASASTLEPQYDDTGMPSFAAEGPQYLIGGKGGEGILANCASGMCDVPMLRDGEYVTAFESYQETGSYDYLGDPSPVPLPAGAVLLLSGLGFLAMKGRRNA